MKPITDLARIKYCGALVRDTMLAQKGSEFAFSPSWVQRNAWKVVPVESAARIPEDYLHTLVSALTGAGHAECIAVFNEPGYLDNLPSTVECTPPAEMSTCYLLSINEVDFREFNYQLGLFRSVLTSDDRTWAISCNESYNLFGAKEAFLERLLGKPIQQARQDFLDFAALVDHGSSESPLFQVAKHYETL